MQENNKENENKKLWSLWYFHLVLWGTIATSLILSSVILYNSSSELISDWNYQGFNFFFTNVLRVPGIVLAVGSAIITLIATIHRSSQTQAQIERAEHQIQETIKQNNFINYYKHRKEFIDTVKTNIEVYKKIGHEKLVLSYISDFIYDLLYPNFRECGLEKNNNLYIELINAMRGIDSLQINSFITASSAGDISSENDIEVYGFKKENFDKNSQTETIYNQINSLLSPLSLQIPSQILQKLINQVRIDSQRGGGHVKRFDSIKDKVIEDVRTLFCIYLSTDIIYKTEFIKLRDEHYDIDVLKQNLKYLP